MAAASAAGAAGTGRADKRRRRREPLGGGDSDGLVNTSFSTDLLGRDNGVIGTVYGRGGLQYVVFDRFGIEEITLAANTIEAIEIDGLTAQTSCSAATRPSIPTATSIARRRNRTSTAPRR